MKQALGGRARGPLHPAQPLSHRVALRPPHSPQAQLQAPPDHRQHPESLWLALGGEGCMPRAAVGWSPPKGHWGSLTGQIWGPHGDFASGEQGCRRPQAGHGSQRRGKRRSWAWGSQQGLQGITREGPGACTGPRAGWAQGVRASWAQGVRVSWAQG